jgi:hypothetical protein
MQRYNTTLTLYEKFSSAHWTRISVSALPNLVKRITLVTIHLYALSFYWEADMLSQFLCYYNIRIDSDYN